MHIVWLPGKKLEGLVRDTGRRGRPYRAGSPCPYSVLWHAGLAAYPPSHLTPTRPLGSILSGAFASLTIRCLNAGSLPGRASRKQVSVPIHLTCGALSYALVDKLPALTH